MRNLNVDCTWQAGLDTGGQFRLVNYGFDQRGQTFPRHTGLVACLKRNLLIACSSSSALDLDLKNSSSPSQGLGSISSSTTLSSTGSYLSDGPGSMASSWCLPRKPIWEWFQFFWYIPVHTSCTGIYWYILVCTSVLVYNGTCWYILVLVYTSIYWYIAACIVLSDAELSVSGYNMVQGGTMKYPKVLLVYTGIYQLVLCFQNWTFC